MQLRAQAKAMNLATIVLGLFGWRGVLGRAAYQRNLSILFLVNLIVGRLDLLSGAAAYGWLAAAVAMGLSFDARRYHDIGRSAAWIVWANVISVAAAIAIFQFIPNILDNIPLPEDWRLDHAVFGRFVIPAVAGVVVGNFVQSLWLASAGSADEPNPYAAPARRFLTPDGDEPDEAALQAIIDRHLAMRKLEIGPKAPLDPIARVATGDQHRRFGRRGA